MKNQHTINQVALLHPKFIPGATGFINDAETALGITLFCAQGLRTFPEQTAIWNEGRLTPGHIVTKAKAGESYHNYGLAIDVVPFMADGIRLDWNYDFSKLVSFAIKYGITWGGYFPSPDRDHFENKFGHDWEFLLALYESKNFIPGTTFVNF